MPRNPDNWKARTYSLKPADDALVKYGAGLLGVSYSDFVRSAIRAYAYHLQMVLEKDKSE